MDVAVRKRRADSWGLACTCSVDSCLLWQGTGRHGGARAQGVCRLRGAAREEARRWHAELSEPLPGCTAVTWREVGGPPPALKGPKEHQEIAQERC